MKDFGRSHCGVLASNALVTAKVSDIDSQLCLNLQSTISVAIVTYPFAFQSGSVPH